ncbi:alpha/beta-hydrolase [Trametes elegans]|nr:alpha/beta-hydrolase [Trametes elegans]
MSSAPVPTVKTIRSSDGAVIYADAVGNPRNPHVVFIHEVTLSSAVFDELLQDRRLTDHLYMVRYDLRCHGRSSVVAGEEGQHAACHADDFSAVLRAFGLRRPIVVAWGLGAAAVADAYAWITPGPISGVVLVAPLLPLSSRAGEMAQMATDRMRRVARALRSSQDAVMSARAKTELVQAVFAGSTRAVPDMLRSAWLGCSIAQPPDSTRRVLARQSDPAPLLEAGRQGLPLMVLVGAQDALVDGAAAVDTLRRHFLDVEAHVVDGGCHALFFDRKDEFMKLLLVFVGRLAVMTLMT